MSIDSPCQGLIEHLLSVPVAPEAETCRSSWGSRVLWTVANMSTMGRTHNSNRETSFCWYGLIGPGQAGCNHTETAEMCLAQRTMSYDCSHRNRSNNRKVWKGTGYPLFVDIGHDRSVVCSNHNLVFLEHWSPVMHSKEHSLELAIKATT